MLLQVGGPAGQGTCIVGLAVARVVLRAAAGRARAVPAARDACAHVVEALAVAAAVRPQALALVLVLHFITITLGSCRVSTNRRQVGAVAAVEARAGVAEHLARPSETRAVDATVA